MKHILKWIFLIAILAIPVKSWGEESMNYQIFVGNHQFIHLMVSPQILDLNVSYMNNTRDHLQYRRTERNFIWEKDGQISIVAMQSEINQEYISLALRLRDFVAMLTSPYPFGDSVTALSLHPELNKIILELDQITSLGDRELANCILFPATGKLKPLTISAGVRGSLGDYQDNISRVWVRQGYELVLLEGPEFETKVERSVIAKGNGQSTGKGLAVLESQPIPARFTEYGSDSDPVNTGGGAHFALSRTSFERRVGSLLCRPDLHY
jgi:hypothetical protein